MLQVLSVYNTLKISRMRYELAVFYTVYLSAVISSLEGKRYNQHASLDTKAIYIYRNTRTLTFSYIK